jgi:hypothetical protein
VARVRVSLEAFHNGALPPVCAKTGEPADCLLPVRAAYTPRWTWLLLVFGGFWAFLIGRGFTTEETTGLVPFSQAALARWRVRGRRRLAAAVVGALVLLALLYRVAWPLAFFGGCALIASLFGGWCRLRLGPPVECRCEAPDPAASAACAPAWNRLDALSASRIRSVRRAAVDPQG